MRKVSGRSQKLRKNKNHNGKNINSSKIKKETKIQLTNCAPMFPLWPKTRLYARLRHVPNLLPRSGK